MTRLLSSMTRLFSPRLHVGVGALGVCMALSGCAVDSKQQPAARATLLPVVEVMPLTACTWQRTQTAVGHTQAVRQATLVTQQAGDVMWRVEEGQIYEAGEPVVRLENPLLNLQQHQAQVHVARTRYLLAQQERLVKGGHASPSTLEQARAEAQTAQADAALAALALQHQIIRAPFTGWAIAPQVKVGQFVQIGEPVMEIVDPTVLEVILTLSPEEALLWREGQAVQASAIAKPGQVFEGQVLRMSPDIRQGRRWITLTFTPPEKDLPPGAFVRLTTKSVESEQAWCVDAEAVHDVDPSSNTGHVAFFIEDTLSWQPVTLLQQQGTQAFILPLEAAEPWTEERRVAVKGQSALRPGTRVRALDRETDEGRHENNEEETKNEGNSDRPS